MRHEIDETHNPDLKTWIESANDSATDFPIQNLPYCAFQRAGHDQNLIGTRIGSKIVDLAALDDAGMFDGLRSELKRLILERDWSNWRPGSSWRDLASVPALARRMIRRRLCALLRAETSELRDSKDVRARALVDVESANVGVPFNTIPNYSDFYASIHHATNVGSMFRPDNPLLPNYKWIPIGYHGRASSIVASGTEIARPSGQLKPDDAEAPTFGPCKLLDYELEVGCFVGEGNRLGEPIPIAEAENHIFGLCIVNDWSARDIQKWEYQPLGPFLAKSFATSISPFVVTLDGLAPFRCPAMERSGNDPKPLPYLSSEANQREGGVEIVLEVLLASKQMRDQDLPAMRVSKGNFKHMYWTIAQLLTHHASNGCNLQPGDLIASGTVSGPEPESRGCLLELTWDGAGKARKPIQLPTGETRTFLANGDEVVMKAYCERKGFRRIGFGECRGVVRIS